MAGDAMDGRGLDDVASQVRAALEAADLERFADILDPAVTWGAPGDASPPCRSRQQVLESWARGRAGGRRARVLDVMGNGDKVLVAMVVTDDARDDEEAARWQVLTVGNGRVTDIRGYDDERAAMAAAGLDR